MVFDDLADQSDLLNTRKGAKSGGSWLTTLACRGRHLQVTWIVSAQKLNSIGLIVRANCRSMCIWRLRSHREMEILAEEMSGYYPKEVCLQLHTYATSEPFSFLFIRLDGKTRRDVFWLRFESRLVLETSEEDKDGRRPLDSSAGRPLEEQRPVRAPGRKKGSALPDAGEAIQTLGKRSVRSDVRIGK